MTPPDITPSSDPPRGPESDARARETALREVLEVISNSRDDEKPVFDVILRNAARLCDASHADLDLVDEDGSHLREVAAWGPAERPIASENWVWGMDSAYSHVVATRDGVTIHVPDLRTTDLYLTGDPMAVAAVDVEKMQTALAVPLIKAGQGIGCLVLFRQVQKPFSDDEIALVEIFAEQAVIAIENVRQFRELQTRLERETATGSILHVISQSRDDENPVFDTILQNASQLCGAETASLMLVNEARTHTRFRRRFGREFRKDIEDKSWPLDAGHAQTEAARTGVVVHEPDLKESALYRNGDPVRTALVDEYGARSALAVPMLRAGQPFGVIVLHRFDVARAFSDSDIRLVETFAAQAVIAIENVRQFRELQARLQRERASAEILEVISQSRDDEKPVFEAILENASALCNAPLAGLILGTANDGLQSLAAYKGMTPEAVELFETGQMRMDGDLSYAARSIIEARLIAFDDMGESDLYKAGSPVVRSMVDASNIRSVLFVPLVRDGIGIGNLTLFRREISPFDEAEISLVETFAAQAVIAIENVRQFKELQTRLAREAATSDVLRVISQSRTDAQPVFQAIHDNVSLLCDAPFSGLFLLDEAAEELEIVSHRGGNPDYVADAKRAWPLSDKAAQCRAVLRREVVHVHDLTETKAYRTGHETTVRAVEVEGIRTFLAVPLMKGSQAIGSIGTYRCEARPFSDGEVELLQTFAAQAVIAIENVRQFNALEQLNAELGDRVSEQVDELERMGRLKRFLSPQVADAVVSSGDENLLGSHRAMIAILFCDIRGFTAFCESAEPEETIEVLQTFHETLGRLIHAAGAGFDHRAGDGIMVVFNDPVPCDEPAAAALRVAVQMRQCMVEICTKWRKLGHRMGFGVGISLGYATVGMVGFEGRYDYTASGTAVNLAARLCDQAEDQEILLSQRAATALEDIAEIETAGELTLKGFHAPVDVFKVTGLKETA